MVNITGVYKTTKKDGSIYYRASLTYKRKHISLGSFNSECSAHKAYLDGKKVLENTNIGLEDYNSKYIISYEKFIILVNFRDNGIFFSTPIYIRKQYFEYYLTPSIILKFDRDDLFFYASHKIQQRGGYLFVSDYGSQYKILSRYGIKPFAVYERDYIMANGDPHDYRYSNIKILNNYTGVRRTEEKGKVTYTSYIHIKGDYIVGHYNTEIQAAIAYNKAVDTLQKNGLNKNYIKNYISSIKKEEYKEMYSKIKISKKIKNYIPEVKI